MVDVRGRISAGLSIATTLLRRGRCVNTTKAGPIWRAQALAATAALCLVNVQSAAAQCPDAASRDAFGGLDLAKVKGGVPKVHFRDDQCEEKKPGGCTRKAFVIPGDEVLVASVLDTSACAVYVDQKGRATAGLLPLSALDRPKKPAATGRDLLVGKWRRVEAEINVKRDKDGSLDFEGYATYGGHDPKRVAIGAVNVGDFSFKASPASNTIDVALVSGPDGDTQPMVVTDASKIPDGECRVSLVALTTYLVAHDNGQCGGHNVTFSGVYRRVK